MSAKGPPPPRRPSARSARGYTAVEVLIAMTVFAIGAAGVISMQRAAVQGTYDARRLDIGSSVTRLWIERLRAETSLWRPTSADTPNPPTIPGAPLLDGIGVTGVGAWTVPKGRLADSPPQSYAFDILGRDLPLSDMKIPPVGQLAFCTNVRLTWLVPGELLRAEVRTYWPRNLTTAPAAAFCSDPPPAGLDTQTDAYHFVYAVTALRRNTQ